MRNFQRRHPTSPSAGRQPSTALRCCVFIVGTSPYIIHKLGGSGQQQKRARNLMKKAEEKNRQKNPSSAGGKMVDSS